MTEQKQRDWKYYLLGCISGVSVGGGVVGLIVKHIYDKKMRKMCQKTVTKTVEYPDGSKINYNSEGKPISGSYTMTIDFGGKTPVVPKTDEVCDRKIAKTVTDPAESEHPTEEDPDIDPNDMNVAIDDLDAYDRTEEERQAYNRYFDLTEQYLGGEGIKTRIIGPEDYMGDYYYEKSAVNWYEDDNVFEEDLDTIDDPFATFGVTNGKQLFEMAANREDPDIVYVRNENQTIDFEISRIHGSYAQKVGGERSLGETDS